ncbi:MAG: hypothetical protein H0T84_07610 [Tatlockia sp.]|nr:hypothetical protein [Tatlockia sp.]
MPLPKIIFCENHYDPISISIINKITPELSKLGYRLFHAEQPDSWTVDDHIEFIEYTENLNANLTPKILVNFSKKNQAVLELEIKYATRRALYHSLNKSFLKSLKKNQMEYAGIDVPRVSTNYENYISEEGFEVRDKRMAKAYIKEERPVFGLIGAFHAKGMQQKILEQMPKDEASNLFYFVHIHKEDSTSQLEDSLRAGEIDHPLGLHIYNANEMSEDEIIATIIQQISIQQMNILKDIEGKASISFQKRYQNQISSSNFFSFDSSNKINDIFEDKKSEKPGKKKNSQYEKLPWQNKHQLIYEIKNSFSEHGVYANSLLSKLDPDGESYRQAIMDFIDKLQHYDAIIDKLKILGRKAQKDLETNSYFSLFKPFYSESKFQSLTSKLVEEFERKPSLNLDFEPQKFSLDEEKEEGFYSPGYNWKIF